MLNPNQVTTRCLANQEETKRKGLVLLEMALVQVQEGKWKVVHIDQVVPLPPPSDVMSGLQPSPPGRPMYSHLKHSSHCTIKEVKNICNNLVFCVCIAIGIMRGLPLITYAARGRVCVSSLLYISNAKRGTGVR